MIREILLLSGVQWAIVTLAIGLPWWIAAKVGRRTRRARRRSKGILRWEADDLIDALMDR